MHHSKHLEVTHTTCTITSRVTVTSALEASKRDVVFHTASPNSMYYHGPGSYYFEVNITGTKLLVEEAKKLHVKAFETIGNAPFWTSQNCPPNHEYGLSKGLADIYVRESATESFKTVAMRPFHLYGIGNAEAIPAALDAGAPGKPLMVFGDGQNLFDICITENCVNGLILSAQTLLNLTLAPHVNGQAFHISDGPAIKFWEFFAEIWSGDRRRDTSS